MKLTTLNNAEMIIQARNEADYKKALKVADIICEEDGFDIAAIEEDCFSIHICAVWSHYQAADLKDLYTEAKKQAK